MWNQSDKRDQDGALVAAAAPAEGTGRGFPAVGWRNVPIVPLALLAVVLGAVAATHWPALSAGATYMDDKIYLGSSAVRHPSWGSLEAIFGSVLSPSLVNGYYQPLSLVSLMLDFLDPKAASSLAPFHRTSLVLHLLNVALIVVLLQRLFRRWGAAAVLGLLYGVHPLNADAVVWVAERKTVLSATLALGSLLAYVAYAQHARRSGRRDWKRYAASLFLCLCALLSKPTALPLFALLLVLDYWPLERQGRGVLLEKIPFLVAALVAGVVAVISQARGGQGGATQLMNLLYVPLVTGYCVGFYLSKICWPTGLVSDYPLPQPFTLANPAVLATVVAVVAVAVLVGLSLRRTRAWLAGGMFFVFALAPTLGIIRYTDSIAANRSVYLAMVGLLLPLAWALTTSSTWIGRALERPGRPRLLAFAAGASVVVLTTGSAAGATRGYQAHWRDSVGLLEYYLTQSPRDWRLHTRLGNEWIGKGDARRAVVAFREASRLRPRWAEGQLNLGRALFTVGEYGQAKVAFEAALRETPADWRAHMLLGMTLSREPDARQDALSGDRDLKGALREFRVAAGLSPAAASTAQYHMARTLAELERRERERCPNPAICLTKGTSNWQSPPP